MADRITCGCPPCRVAAHAAQVGAEAKAAGTEDDTIGLLLAAVVKAGRKAGWDGAKIAHVVLRAGGQLMVEHLAETAFSGTQAPPPPAPSARGRLH